MAKEPITGIVTEKTDKETGTVTPSMSATVELDIGKNETIDWYVKEFGEKVVHSKIYQKVAIDAQARIRSLLTAGKTPDEVAAAMATWKPGVTAPKKGLMEKTFAGVDQMNDDQLAEFIAKLQDRAGKAKK